MKFNIIAVSDLHLDDIEGREESLETIDKIVRSKADILLVGGDIAQSKEKINKGLELFSRFKGIKLAYLGNHELRTLENSSFGNHYDELSDLFKINNFQLLDQHAFHKCGLCIVGNAGWFDYSLYKGENLEHMMSAKQYHNTHRTGGLSPQEFTNHCINQVNSQINHLQEFYRGNASILLGFHHVGFETMLKYGHSEIFDYKNNLMGSQKLKEVYKHKNIIAGFCGHNHRSQTIKYKGKKVYNISSDKNQRFLKLTVESSDKTGQYEITRSRKMK